MKNFNKILEQNSFEVGELLRQSNIIRQKDETLIEGCFRAYKKDGNSFAYKLSEILARNIDVSNFSYYDSSTNIDENTITFDNPEPATPDTNSGATTVPTGQSKFDKIFGAVTNVLNAGINAFGAFQTARSARDMSNWQYQQAYYDRLNKEKQNRNLLILVALIVFAIIVIVVVRKY